MNLANSLLELTESQHVDGQFLTKPILITANGTIVSGFRDWHAALIDSVTTVDCFQYSLNDEEALRFILTHYRPRRFWNSFSRIRLALELESYFQEKASANQSHGGKYKGSANLPKAACIEVRQVIARLAGVGTRNVSNVKTILEKAHPRLIAAVQDGTLSIHRAIQFCNVPRAEQLDLLVSHEVERATSKVTRQTVAQLSMKERVPHADAVLKALQAWELREPGSIVVRAGMGTETVILLGRDLLASLQSQTESLA